MKSLDANVLVRLLVNDDPRQGEAARALLENAERRREPLLVTVPVVLELLWVLRSAYDFPRSAILESLERLTLAQALRFEAVERIGEAVSLARRDGTDPADVLIGLTARDQGCETTLTFDKRAAKSNLFEILRVNG